MLPAKKLILLLCVQESQEISQSRCAQLNTTSKGTLANEGHPTLRVTLLTCSRVRRLKLIPSISGCNIVLAMRQDTLDLEPVLNETTSPQGVLKLVSQHA